LADWIDNTWSESFVAKVCWHFCCIEKAAILLLPVLSTPLSRKQSDMQPPIFRLSGSTSHCSLLKAVHPEYPNGTSPFLLEGRSLWRPPARGSVKNYLNSQEQNFIPHVHLKYFSTDQGMSKSYLQLNPSFLVCDFAYQHSPEVFKICKCSKFTRRSYLYLVPQNLRMRHEYLVMFEGCRSVSHQCFNKIHTPYTSLFHQDFLLQKFQYVTCLSLYERIESSKE
jgi:hypothetical protein